MMSFRKITIALVLATTASTVGCYAAAVPFQKSTYKSTYKKDWPYGQYNIEEPASAFCERVATNADSYAQGEMGLGIALAVVAGGGAIAGAAMGPDTGPNANWAEVNRNTLVIGASGLIGAVAATLLVLSRNSSTVSGAAALAMAEDDPKKKMAMCLAARAELASGRAEATATWLKRVEDEAAKKASDEAAKKAADEAAKKAADEAAKKAADEAAKKAADEAAKKAADEAVSSSTDPVALALHPRAPS